jgi:hypothetical protein
VVTWLSELHVVSDFFVVSVFLRNDVAEAAPSNLMGVQWSVYALFPAFVVRTGWLCETVFLVSQELSIPVLPHTFTV